MKRLKIQLSGETFSCDTEKVILRLKNDSLTVSGSLYILADLDEVRCGSYFHYLYLQYDETLLNDPCLDPSDVCDVCCLSCEGFYLQSLITEEDAADIYLSSVDPVTDGSDGQYIGTMSDASTLNIDLSGLLSVIGTDKFVDGLIPNPAGSGTGDDGLYLLQFNDATTIPIDLSSLSNEDETLTSVDVNGDYLEYTDEDGVTHSFLLPNATPCEEIAVSYTGGGWQAVTFSLVYYDTPSVIPRLDPDTLVNHDVQIRNVTSTGCEVRVIDGAGDSNSYSISLKVMGAVDGFAAQSKGEDLAVAYTGGGWQSETFVNSYSAVPTITPLLDFSTLAGHSVQVKNITLTGCDVRVVDSSGTGGTYNITLQVGDK